MTKTIFCLLFVTVAASADRGFAREFELAAPDSYAKILVAPTEPESLRLAAQDLINDVEKITGRRLSIVARLEDCGGQCVVVGSASNPQSAQLISRFAPRLVDEVKGKWEAYRVETTNKKVGAVTSALIVAGSDERAAVFGVYAFVEKYLQVDPLYFWTDREPAKRERLAWEKVSIKGDEPTFRFRGWFINDEDLLTEWREDGGPRHIEYPFYHQVTSPAIHERVFEAMLRSGYNLVIPASFTDVANPAERRMIEQATRRGLYVTMHHVEPLGVSAFAFQNYWGQRGRRDVPFSFVSHRKEFEEVWRYYAALWARFPGVVWQVGLRGIADRPVWVSDPNVPKTDEGRGKLISDAMQLQAEIIRGVDRRPSPPMTTTLWMEGSDLNRKGFLKFPEKVAVIFSDNSPGWKMQADFFDTRREPARDYGIYYHHAIWAQGPHFVQAASPHKTHEIFQAAVKRGSHSYAMLNVANVREFALGIEASSQMLRDFNNFEPDRFLAEWCRERFGEGARAAEEAYRQFFASYVNDDERGYPLLLDGRIISAGNRIYARLLSQNALASETFSGETKNLPALLGQIRKQRRAVGEAGAAGERAARQMNANQRAFFTTNFIAQQRMMHGLLGWLEAGVNATLAHESKDAAGYKRELLAGKLAFAEVRAAQGLASTGKWKDWYRGDRKMNLRQAEYLTDQLIEEATKAPTGSGRARR